MTQTRLAEPRTISDLRRAASCCRDCDLYQGATQVVFGEGPAPAPLMLLGEQPGDQEDRAGHPFVGPAGALLDEVLDEVGIVRDEVYLTNAVKHFKWVRGNGKVRIHKSPSRAEVVACSRWWERELELVDPQVLVCLGAVAAKAVLGPSARVSQIRGQVIEQLDRVIVPTIHPAAVLRGRELRAELRSQLAADLGVAARLVQAGVNR